MTGQHNSSSAFLNNVALFPTSRLQHSCTLDARSTLSVLSIASEKIGAKPVSCYKRKSETGFCQVQAKNILSSPVITQAVSLKISKSWVKWKACASMPDDYARAKRLRVSLCSNNGTERPTGSRGDGFCQNR
ncbi:MAG: hypothetical protein H0V70_07185 [Ktedonobacteraceae bacterium]|nr:hypothetical protein [Ktedonobacteraceae bacterium]